MTMNPDTPTPTPAAPVPAEATAPVAAPAAGSGEAYDMLKRLVAEAESDYQKAIGGNKAAGTRVRKMMQDIKDAAQTIRKRVLESRSTTP
jgi:hypothetical protein